MFSLNRPTGDLERSVRAATRGLTHRGPDDGDATVVQDGVNGGLSVIFGHRRLSIIDLSSAGHQPMLHAPTRNWITYNGEIYNYAELRTTLVAQGHAFRTKTDTEVILAAYAEWGVGCLKRLRGIFAFGLWDARQSRLLLARDHLGVKPLYVAHGPTGTWFASEVRSFLEAGAVQPRLDHDAVGSYLKYGSVQEPLTLLAGVRSLPAGSVLQVCRDGRTEEHAFWSIDCCLHATSKADSGRAVEVLVDAVRMQLVADVPVGVFLSSGVDSATIAALASQAGQGDVRTFCVGGDDRAQDERDGASAIAQELGCRHTNLYVDGASARQELPDVLARSDQPSVDGLNTYYISKAVRSAGIKVALSGLGADELFVGYNGFAKPRALGRWGRRLRHLPDAASRLAGRSLARCQPPGSARSGPLAQLLTRPEDHSYFSSRLIFSEPHIGALLSPSFTAQAAPSAWRQREERLVQAAADRAEINRISALELQTYMLSTLLRDADQMSMAHGLEVRVPYLDSVLVETVLPLPAALKMGPSGSKHILRTVLAQHLDWSRHQRPKRGFNLPIEGWMRGELSTLVKGTLERGDAEVWRPGALRHLWDQFANGRVSWSRVWTVFMLESWLQRHGVKP